MEEDGGGWRMEEPLKNFVKHNQRNVRRRIPGPFYKMACTKNRKKQALCNENFHETHVWRSVRDPFYLVAKKRNRNSQSD